MDARENKLSTDQESQKFIRDLFREHNAALLKFLTHKLSNPDEAADVAQSAFQKMLSVTEPERLENAKSYLYQTAMNLAIDRIRKSQRRDGHLRSLANESTDREDLRSPSPENLIITRQELARVNQSIDELPEKCRQAFLMHRGQQMTYGEIGNTLGVSVSMVEKYIIRALKHLRENLK